MGGRFHDKSEPGYDITIVNNCAKGRRLEANYSSIRHVSATSKGCNSLCVQMTCIHAPEPHAGSLRMCIHALRFASCTW